MNEIEIKVKEYIKRKCYGKENSETYSHLAFYLNLNEREVRDIVSRLVTEHQIHIGTSQHGYFYISCDEEYRLAHSELISRIKALSQRAKGLRIGYSKIDIKPKQLELV